MRVYCQECGNIVTASPETPFVWKCNPHGHIVWKTEESAQHSVAPAVEEQESLSYSGVGEWRISFDRKRGTKILIQFED